MTWRTFLALAVFVAMCGFIAYWGDLLGRRMGKRRLSLFGLRPRYTAIVTTTITGMLIAVCTIVVMATVSQRVKLLMIQGDQILRERGIIRQQYEATKHEYDKATRELGRQRGFAARARKEADEAITQRDKMVKEIARITRELRRLKADLRSNQIALIRTERQLRSANKEIEHRRVEIADAKKEIARLEWQRTKIIQSYFEEQLQETARYAELRENPIIFRQYQEIARKVIKCAQSQMDIRADVLALLYDADRRARAAGAKVGDDGRAISMLAKEFKGRFLKESETIDAIVDNIASGSGSVVLLILSVGNSFEGEPVLVDFSRPYYNLRVYSAGGEVARTTIDGSQSEGRILESLILFLGNEVRAAAIGRGIIPTTDESGRPSVGQIGWDELFDLADRIKTAGKPVVVRAIADKETWSGDSLPTRLIVSEPQ